MSRPKRVKRSLRLISQGKVTLHPQRGIQPEHVTEEGRIFHPDQRPYFWVLRKGYAKPGAGGVLALTKDGAKARKGLTRG